MSTIGITSNLTKQVAGLPSAANQFVTDLNRLAHDLQNGDLAAAQQDLIQFSEGVLTSLNSLPATAMAEPAVATPGEQAVQIHEPTPATAPATPAEPAPSLDVQA